MIVFFFVTMLNQHGLYNVLMSVIIFLDGTVRVPVFSRARGVRCKQRWFRKGRHASCINCFLTTPSWQETHTSVERDYRSKQSQEWAKVWKLASPRPPPYPPWFISRLRDVGSPTQLVFLPEPQPPASYSVTTEGDDFISATVWNHCLFFKGLQHYWEQTWRT